MLQVWHHPKTQEIRLYFSRAAVQEALDVADAALELESVRGWVYDHNGRPKVKVSVKQDSPVDRRLISDIQDALYRSAPFCESDSWEKILADVETPPESITEPDTSEPPASVDDRAIDPSPDAQGFIRQAQLRAGDASKLQIATIKIAKPVLIEVGHKETRLIAELLSEHEKIEIAREALDLGAFRVTDEAGNQLLIERKRCPSKDAHDDFEASINRGGQLFDMAARLKFEVENSNHQVIPIIILEGNLHTQASGMLLQQIDGALSYLAAVQRISILTSLNVNHSAYIIAKLASHFIEGEYALPANRGPKPKTLFNQKLYVLESIPSISTHTAERLLERFGSIAAVAVASEGELARVKGVGLKRAREIHGVLGR
jgi:ERCC4-type nuclease